MVVAYVVHESGHREVIGIDIGQTATEASGSSSCAACAHEASTAFVSQSATTTRAPRPRSSGPPAAHGSAAPSTSSATCKAIADDQSAASSPQHRARSSTPPGLEAATARLGDVLERFRDPLPKIAELLESAQEDLLAFYQFPSGASAKTQKHQPARARQPRNRTPHRRRRHLPKQRLRHPTRRRPPDRTKRSVARQPPLPLNRIDRPDPRERTQQRTRRGSRTQSRKTPRRAVTPPHAT